MNICAVGGSVKVESKLPSVIMLMRGLKVGCYNDMSISSLVGIEG
ncbi:MAG: hypothetical protein ACI9UU_003067 [Candidatus Azotimanducaceae bacterium]